MKKWSVYRCPNTHDFSHELVVEIYDPSKQTLFPIPLVQWTYNPGTPEYEQWSAIIERIHYDKMKQRCKEYEDKWPQIKNHEN